MRPMLGRYLMLFVCRVPVEVAHENVLLPCASTVLTVLVITANRFRREVSAASAPSVRMRDKTVCGKVTAVAHRRALMRKLTKAAMWSNAPSTA